MEINFFWIAVGLAALGYFIGNGLKNFAKGEKKKKSYYANHLIKEKDLPHYLLLSQEEVKDLLHKYPGVPKLELDGTTYYPYQPLIDWMTSEELYKK